MAFVGHIDQLFVMADSHIYWFLEIPYVVAFYTRIPFNRNWFLRARFIKHAHEYAVGRENLDAVIVLIRHEYVARRVYRNALGIAEHAFVRPSRVPCAYRMAVCVAVQHYYPLPMRITTSASTSVRHYQAPATVRGKAARLNIGVASATAVVGAHERAIFDEVAERLVSLGPRSLRQQNRRCQ